MARIPVDRKTARRSVACAALWYPTQGAPQPGIICDVSTRGAFVQSLSAMLLQPGERVRIVFFVNTPTGEVRVDSPATVRWAGMNAMHRCAGFGVEFDHPEDDILQLHAMSQEHKPA